MEAMLQNMMKRYPLFVVMGVMLVAIALIIGAVTAANAAGYYEVDKLTRDSSTDLASVRAGIESTVVWLPYFKFVGLGMILAGITMALGLIATTLRQTGIDVTSRWPARLHPGVPEKPRTARIFPLVMMMGVMVLIVGLIWGLGLIGVAGSYWNHAIASELNPAQPGSDLLAQLGVLSGSLKWLGALRFLGMAMLFTGITVALTVILRTLQTQETMLAGFLEEKVRRA